MDKQTEILDKNWHEIKSKCNVLDAFIGTKYKGGLDTGIPAIVVFVGKKVPIDELQQNDIIPDSYNGVITDVTELKPKTWTAGHTSINDLPYDTKKIISSGSIQSKTDKQKGGNEKSGIGQSDWTAWGSPIQYQGGCGSCTAFGVTGVAETCIRINEGDIINPIKLSEGHLFFCAGGTCSVGLFIEDALNKFIQGVCLESCLPYLPYDQVCMQGICDNWQDNAVYLERWNKTQSHEDLLDTKPLVVSMPIYQSFFSYTGGIYQRQGEQDPYVGLHCVGEFGYNNVDNYRIIRNSWGVGWGSNCVINNVNRPGYGMVVSDIIDPDAYELIFRAKQQYQPSGSKKMRCNRLGRLNRIRR